MNIISTLIYLEGFTFDGTIGVGSIISVIIMLIGFAASWYKMQTKSVGYEKDIINSIAATAELGKQVNLLSLTVERLSTLSEINEKRWEYSDRHDKN